MKRFARMLFAGLGIAIAGSAISLVPHKAATATGGAPVTVLNPSLAVTQSGPWNVGINGTPNVNIGTPTVNLGAGNTVGINGTVQVASSSSSPMLVKDVNSPALNPFYLDLAAAPGITSQHNFTIDAQAPVPAGQRLVLEDISVSGFVPAANQLTDVCVGIKGGDNTVCVSPQAGDRTVDATGILSLYGYNRLVRAYFNAGDVIEAIFAQDEITPTPCCPPPGLVTVHLYMHGHYEAVP